MNQSASGAVLKEDYHGYVKRKIVFTAAILALIIIISGVALTLGGRKSVPMRCSVVTQKHFTTGTELPSSNDNIAVPMACTKAWNI